MTRHLVKLITWNNTDHLLFNQLLSRQNEAIRQTNTFSTAMSKYVLKSYTWVENHVLNVLNWHKSLLHYQFRNVSTFTSRKQPFPLQGHLTLPSCGSKANETSIQQESNLAGGYEVIDTYPGLWTSKLKIYFFVARRLKRPPLGFL